jgi:hypothetical protein
MLDIHLILQLVTLVVLSVGGYLVALFKAASEAAVKTSAEETAKAASRDLHWRAELARELQKSRGVGRQELRFKGYGSLWKVLRPLAIYDATIIDAKTVGALFRRLTDWYFSECGGLLLTPQAREFYFALQDLLLVVSRVPGEWRAERFGELEGDAEPMLLSASLERNAEEAVCTLNYFKRGGFEDWRDKGGIVGQEWRKALKELGSAWTELNERQRFAVLQQAGSKLRASLANDLESRDR